MLSESEKHSHTTTENPKNKAKRGEQKNKTNEICNADFIAWENFTLALRIFPSTNETEEEMPKRMQVQFNLH